MRRVSDGRTSRRLRTTVSAHHVVFPCPPQPSRLSVSYWLHSVPGVSFTLSLCLPSVVVSHRSLSPLLSPLSRTFTRPCLFQQLPPPLRRCYTCSAEQSVAPTESQCCLASVSGFNVPMILKFRLQLVRRRLRANKVCWCFIGPCLS